MNDLLPVLSEADLALIQKKELENAIAKLQSGGSLNKREREIIEAAAARSKPPRPAAAASTSAPPEPTGAATTLNRTDIAVLYADASGVPLSLRTIDRVNHIATLPDVGIPAPWHDARALAEWFRAHYRSDPSKPAPSKPRALPAWLEQAARRAPAASPTPAGSATTGDPVSNTTPAALPEPEMDELPLIDPIAFARQLVETAQKKYNAVRHIPAEADAARRAYFECHEKLQLAEERARKAGNTDDLRRDLVARHLETLHGRIIRRLVLDLTSVRAEAMRASASPETWAAWVKASIHASCRRLTESRFAADLAALGESASGSPANPAAA